MFVDLKLGLGDGDRFSLVRKGFQDGVFDIFDFHLFAVDPSKGSHPQSVARLSRGYGMVLVGRLPGAAYGLAWANQSRLENVPGDGRSWQPVQLARVLRGRQDVAANPTNSGFQLRQSRNG